MQQPRHQRRRRVRPRFLPFILGVFAVCSVAAAAGSARAAAGGPVLAPVADSTSLAKSWRGASLALVIGGLLNGWAPVAVWLGWLFVFNRMVVARIGSPLYNYRPGLLAVIAALTFTTVLGAAFGMARRVWPPRRHPVRDVSRGVALPSTVTGAAGGRRRG